MNLFGRVQTEIQSFNALNLEFFGFVICLAFRI